MSKELMDRMLGIQPANSGNPAEAQVPPAPVAEDDEPPKIGAPVSPVPVAEDEEPPKVAVSTSDQAASADDDAEPVVANKPVESPAQGRDDRKKKADALDPTAGGTRPRNRWYHRVGCTALVAIGVVCGCRGVTVAASAFSGGGSISMDIDPQAIPIHYGRGVALVFGDTETKLKMLAEYDREFIDCKIGRPEGYINGDNDAPDEEFRLARPLFLVFTSIRDNNRTNLESYAQRSYDATIVSHIQQNMNSDFNALNQRMSSLSDFEQIDVFVSEISKGLPDDEETAQKILRVKDVLYAGAVNRQRQGWRIWEKLPESYIAQGVGATHCEPLSLRDLRDQTIAETQPINQVPAVRVLTKADGRAYRNAVAQIRKNVGM